MGSESGYYKEIINKLERFVKKEYALFISLGIQALLLIGILIFTNFAFLEMLEHFSAEFRTILIYIFGCLFFLFFLALVLMPLLKYFNIFRRTDYYKTAGRVGRHFPAIKDDLLNAMQLVSSDSKEGKYSNNLIEAAFHNVYNRAKNVNFSSIVSFQKTKELLLYFLGISAFCIIILAFIPGLHAATYRLVNYNREFIAPPKFTFEVEPGNSKITKGDNLTISVKVNGNIPKEVFLAVKNNDQTNFELQQLYGDSLGNFHYEIPAVRNSFRYYAASENIKSGIYSIEVIDRPIVKTLDVKVTSPSYSKIAQTEQKDNGNVTALLGSVVDLKISSTKMLKKAKLEFGDTTKQNLQINGQYAAGKFKIKKDNNYRIILTDENDNKNLSPINYTIKALYDAYPSIDIIAPNKDVSLSANNRLPLEGKISDDYGFTKLLLHYRLSSSKYETPQKEFKTIEIPFDKSLTSEEVNYLWNLTDLGLTEQDVVTYFFEIFDNDNVSGPKSTKSSSFTVSVPTLNELLNQANDVQSQSEKDLQETFKEAEDLRQKLDNINNELKQNKKKSPGRKNKRSSRR